MATVNLTHEEREQIATELKRKFSSAIYSIVPWQLDNTDVWECQTFTKDGYDESATFRVRAFITSYGVMTQAV